MRGVTWVLVEEVKSGQWSIGGQPLSTADVKAMAGRRGGRLNNHPQGRCGQAGSYAHAGEGVGEVFRDNGSVPWGNGQPPKPRILTPSTATTAAIGLARPRTQLGRIGDAIRRPCRLELGPAAAHGRGNGSGHDLLGTSGRSPPSGKHELSAARAPPAVSSSRTRRRHTGRHTARSQHEDTKESPRPRSHHDQGVTTTLTLPLVEIAEPVAEGTAAAPVLEVLHHAVSICAELDPDLLHSTTAAGRAATSLARLARSAVAALARIPGSLSTTGRGSWCSAQPPRRRTPSWKKPFAPAPERLGRSRY